MKFINNKTFAEKLCTYKRHPLSFLIMLITCFCALITLLIAAVIILYIIIKGVPHLSPKLFAFNYTSENVSMLPAIINTVTTILLTLAIAAPIGIFSAVYLTEYANPTSRLVKIIRITTETLAGIPSIVYGLFGLLTFVIALNLGNSILAGSLTLALMVLPTIIRITEESILSVPSSYREAAFGLGAGKLRTIFKITLPCAARGIRAGIILSIGRIIGETAALIYTSGTVAGISNSIFKSGRTLSVHMYALLNEGLYTNEAYATAVVLLLTVFLVNLLSNSAVD